jgi:hypothetical protein
MKFFCALLFVIVLSQQVNAQDKYGKGYYVTNNGDTLKGYVQHRSVYRRDVNFRSSGKGSVQKLTTKEVAAFGFDGGASYLRVNHPTSENTAGDSVFVKPMIKGAIDLYSYDGKMVIGSDEKGRFALAKKTSDAAEALKGQQANTAAFNVLFYDCTSTKEEAQNVHITKEGVTKLVVSYHDCLGLPYRTSNSVKGRRMVDVGFFAGFYLPSLSIGPWEGSKKEDAYELKFDNASSATFGINALIGTRSPSPILTFMTGLAFAKGEHQGKWTFNGIEGSTPVTQQAIARVEYNKMTISAGARFSARSNVLNPYLSLGFNFHKFLSLKEDVVVISSNSTGQQNSTLGMDKTFFGIYAAAGLRKKIARNLAVFAECNYENSYIDMRGLTSSSDLARLKAISLRFGVLF